MRIQKKLLTAASLAAMLTGVIACSSSSDDDEDTGILDPISGLIDPDPNGPATSGMASPTIDLVPTRSDSSIGTVYVAGDDDLTLYTLTSTEANMFGCDPTCEANWPPLITEVSTNGISGEFDVIGRDDSSYQWMLSGYPLYYYSGDASAGDVTGEGLGDRWFVARPIPVGSASNSDDEEISVASGSTLNADGTRAEKDGFTLYFFDEDTAGASSCNDACAEVWPALLADRGARAYDRYSLITREDGAQQWAYDEKPLYFYAGDNAPGDTLGDGVNNLWTVVMP